MNGFRRGVAVGVLSVLALGAAAWLGFEAFIAREERRPSAPTVAAAIDAGQAPPRQVHARVVRVVGAAERKGTDDVWAPLTEGAELEENDRVRALRGGAIDVQVGDASSLLTIPEGTELTVSELSDVLHQFKIGRGRISVDYKPSGGRTLRVESESGAFAQTKGARFTVLSTGTSVAVAAERGSVDLTSAGRTVTVEEGSQSVALLGLAPSSAEPIPTEVLLEVARGSVGPKECLTLSGSVRPGTAVEVNGEAVEVDGNGEFNVSVERRPGLSRVKVTAREPSGTVKEQQYACQKQTRAVAKFKWGE